MKFRFRNFTRSGWHVVEVPRTNLYKWDSAYADERVGNQVHYQEICNWCAKNVPSGKWVSSYHTPEKPGTKRFAFADEKYVTLFRLKWS